MQSFTTEYGNFNNIDSDPLAGNYLWNNDVMQGAGFNDLPTLSMPPQTASQGGWDTFHNIMGAVGSVTQTARDLGTAVGTIERDIRGAGTAYQTARQDAKSGNQLAQWWTYAPTTDKVMVGLAAAGLVLVVIQMVRK